MRCDRRVRLLNGNGAFNGARMPQNDINENLFARSSCMGIYGYGREWRIDVARSCWSVDRQSEKLHYAITICFEWLSHSSRHNAHARHTHTHTATRFDRFGQSPFRVKYQTKRRKEKKKLFDFDCGDKDTLVRRTSCAHQFSSSQRIAHPLNCIDRCVRVRPTIWIIFFSDSSQNRNRSFGNFNPSFTLIHSWSVQSTSTGLHKRLPLTVSSLRGKRFNGYVLEMKNMKIGEHGGSA